MPINPVKKQKEHQKKLYLDIIKGLNLSKRKSYTLKKMFEDQYRNLTLGILSKRDELDKQIANYEHSYVHRGQKYNDMQFITNTQYAIEQGMFPVHNYKMGKWVGVEIECTMPYPKTIKRKVDRGHDFDDFTYECHKALKEEFKSLNMNFIDVKYDGSIQIDHDEHFGVELTLCFINDEKGFHKLERLCQYLEKAKAKVNKSCGLHIHLDMRGVLRPVIEAQATRLINALPALFRLVPGTRMNNRYCKMNKEFTWRQSDKYYAVNMLSHSQHETIEIRLHSGTTNYEKISNWIKLLWTIKESKEFTNTQVTIAKNPTAYLFDAINLDSDIQRFYFKREVAFEESGRQDSELGEDLILRRQARVVPSRETRVRIDDTVARNNVWGDNNGLTFQPLQPRQLSVDPMSSYYVTDTVVDSNGPAIDNTLITNIQQQISRLSDQIMRDSMVFGTGMLQVDTNGAIPVTGQDTNVTIRSSDELRPSYTYEFSSAWDGDSDDSNDVF